MTTGQQVLTVPSRGVGWLFERRKFYDGDISPFWTFVRDNAQFVDREWAERSDDVTQLIGCAIIANGHKILCARRAKKNTRSALALRWTMMFGGHVDDIDRRAANPIVNCILREISEELGFCPDVEPELLGLAVDPATEVGRHHIGVVFLVRTNVDHIVLHRGLDRTEFVNAHKRHLLHFGDVDSVSKLCLSGKFDPWSELFVSSQAARKIMHISNKSQAELDLTW